MRLDITLCVSALAALLAIANHEKPFFAQHGDDVPCKQWCATAGHEDEAEPPDGIPVVPCKGTSETSCAGQGAQCGKSHRSGCTEFCRAHCCSCCSI